MMRNLIPLDASARASHKKVSPKIRLRRPAFFGLLALFATAFSAAAVTALKSPNLQDVPSLAPPERPLSVYHLGHSLVGPDMPGFLAQLADAGFPASQPPKHRYRVQRGSGTSLRAHWEETEPILDFEAANPPPLWQPPKEALRSGAFDAVVLTEMVELRDALAYFDGARYFHKWADLARAGAETGRDAGQETGQETGQEVRVYLYETWHPLDSPEGWEARIAQDLEPLWLHGLMGRDSRRSRDHPAYLIPAGQVLARVVRAADAGALPGISSRYAFFAKDAQGKQDMIHPSDLGAYVVALCHYAVLYHRSPEGLPHQLLRQDGTQMTPLAPDTAARIQALVWQEVLTHPRSGLAAAAHPPETR